MPVIHNVQYWANKTGRQKWNATISEIINCTCVWSFKALAVPLNQVLKQILSNNLVNFPVGSGLFAVNFLKDLDVIVQI